MPESADDNPIAAAAANTADLAAGLDAAGRLSRSLGSALASALDQGIVKGRSLDTVLSGLALRLSNIALNAALKPVTDGIGSVLTGAIDSLTGATTRFAKGGVVGTPTSPLMTNGVVAAPTYFPMTGNSLGVAGEAGAEAIMPLARDGNGQLGVRTTSGAAPMNVTINIATPDVAGFRRSEAAVTASLARAVARGRRGL
jgi:lambda family phage tail tape measure protein